MYGFCWKPSLTKRILTQRREDAKKPWKGIEDDGRSDRAIPVCSLGRKRVGPSIKSFVLAFVFVFLCAFVSFRRIFMIFGKRCRDVACPRVTSCPLVISTNY